MDWEMGDEWGPDYFDSAAHYDLSQDTIDGLQEMILNAR